MARKTSGGYPDFDTPLNVPKAAKEPGEDVDGRIPGDNGANAPDPLGYLTLTGGGKKKK